MGPLESFVNEVALGAYTPDELRYKAILALKRNRESQSQSQSQVNAQAVILKSPFPVMLRKMWSGSEVQEWIQQNSTPLAVQPIDPELGRK